MDGILECGMWRVCSRQTVSKPRTIESLGLKNASHTRADTLLGVKVLEDENLVVSLAPEIIKLLLWIVHHVHGWPCVFALDVVGLGKVSAVIYSPPVTQHKRPVPYFAHKRAPYALITISMALLPAHRPDRQRGI